MSENELGDRLDSWKEIAAHLRRDESTVRRWEKGGLPVHRHRHKSRAAVFAYKSELDAWWQRDGTNTASATPALEVVETTNVAMAPGRPARRHPLLWPGIVLATLVLSLVGARVVYPAGSAPPSIAPVLTPFLSAEGDVSYPAFAPDGSQLAFVWATPDAPHASVYVKALGGGEATRLTHPTDGADSAARWSPDGRQIAFLRTTATESSIAVVPSTGGPEHTLLTLRPDRYFDLDWSADGKSIAFAERASERDPYAIFLLNVRDGTRQQVTQAPPGSFGEVRFSLSPDGRQLAFLRHEAESASIALQVASVDDPSSIRLVASYSEWVGGIAWGAAGDSLILAGNHGGIRKLWRVSLKTGRDEELAGLGTDEYYPAVSKQGNRVAFVRNIEDCDLWRSELTADGAGRTPVRIVSSKRIEGAPRFSPDGKRLAFQSYRSGVPEIWTSNPDGTDALQVTNLRTSKPEMPAWSPDGRLIAFADGGFHVIGSTGGQPRRLFADSDDFDGPSWSHDGQSLYFWRRHLGEEAQIWRVPASGGVEVQVTRNGGTSSMESADGRFLYFTKLTRPGIWRMPTSGGAETLIIPSMPSDFPGYWALAADGIYYLNGSHPDTPEVDFYRFASRDTRKVVSLNGQPVAWSGGLTLSPDRTSLVFSLRQYSSVELILADNVR